MLFYQIPVPDHLPSLEVKAEGMPFFAQCINGTIENSRRASRTSFIIERIERAIVGVLPVDTPISRIQTPNGIPPIGISHGQNSALLNRDGTKTSSYFCIPSDRQ